MKCSSCGRHINPLEDVYECRDGEVACDDCPSLYPQEVYGSRGAWNFGGW